METIVAEDLAAFVAVVKDGSFSGAADRLGVTKSTVSKRVSRLEERLSAPLLRRTTRALHLTDVGARFFQRAQEILEALREAEAEVREAQVEVRGRVRVNAPVSLGLSRLAPLVLELMRAHPRLEVELDLSDRQVDLVAEGYDLAIRVGALHDSSLVAQKLAEVPFQVVASPAYLRAKGRPKRPEQLKAHACLRYRYQASGNKWAFERAGKPLLVAVAGPLLSNHGDVLAEAAVKGLGVALLPRFIVKPHLKSGALVPLFSRSCRVTAPVHAVFPPGRRVPKKTRVLVEALAARSDEWSA